MKQNGREIQEADKPDGLHSFREVDKVEVINPP